MFKQEFDVTYLSSIFILLYKLYVEIKIQSVSNLWQNVLVTQ